MELGYSTPCWIWQRALNTYGYGQVTRRQHPSHTAHRMMYERVRGPIPDGLELDHLCRNRACVNPDHLEPVTGAENRRRGAGTKLTVDEVKAIKGLGRSQPFVVTADRFGVSPSLISLIHSGKVWADV